MSEQNNNYDKYFSFSYINLLMTYSIRIRLFLIKNYILDRSTVDWCYQSCTGFWGNIIQTLVILIWSSTTEQIYVTDGPTQYCHTARYPCVSKPSDHLAGDQGLMRVLMPQNTQGGGGGALCKLLSGGVPLALWNPDPV